MSLAGKRVVNTRAAHQAAALDSLLRARGAVPLDYPCIALLPPVNSDALDQALQADFDLLVLTSANAVLILAERASALGLSLADAPAAAVGAATAQTARELLGVEIRFVPVEYSAESLAESLTVTRGMRILLPQSEIAPPTLAESLRARGARVTAVPAYRTVRGGGGVELAPLLRAGQVDAISFTSPSTVRFLIERLDAEGDTDLGGVCVACIGSQTRRAAREHGLAVAVEPPVHSLDALVELLAAYFEQSS